MLFNWFKRKREYKINPIDVTEILPILPGDKYILTIGDERHEPSEDDIKRIIKYFEDLVKGESSIIALSSKMKITILRDGSLKNKPKPKCMQTDIILDSAYGGKIVKKTKQQKGGMKKDE